MSCCVDDVPAISLDPRSVSEGLKGGTVKFENDKIKTPEMCLGAKLQKKSMNGIPCWAITSEECIEAAVDTVKASIAKSEWLITKGAGTPMNITFVPKLDNSPEPAPNDITLHQEMIGMLWWATELGRVDILHEILILSQCQAALRENQVKQL